MPEQASSSSTAATDSALPQGLEYSMPVKLPFGTLLDNFIKVALRIVRMAGKHFKIQNAEQDALVS